MSDERRLSGHPFPSRHDSCLPMTCRCSVPFRSRPGRHRRLALWIACLVLVCLAGPALAQQPPREVRVTSQATGNLLAWVDGGNDGATTFIRYEVGRSTTRGGAYAVVGNSTTLSFLDTTAATGTAYFYVVRDVNSGGTTAWSEEILRFWPQDGATADSQTLWNEYTVWAHWPIYDNEIVKTFVGLGTAPGLADVIDFIDVGHATEHTFAGVSLTPGQTYHVTVKVQNSKGYLNDYGTSVSSSDGFTVNVTPNLTDTASSTGFNNAPARVMTGINANDVTSPMFSGNGGAVWRYRAPLTVTEPGVESRFNAPCEFSITRPTAEVAANRWDEELRVADEWGNEARVVVTSQGTSGANNLATATLIVNLPRGGSRTYWVYWGNPSATVPAYGFVTNSNDTSQRAFSAFYSRKLLPPGVETWALSTYTSVWGAGGTIDDSGVWLALPWTFNFFGTNRTNLYFATNSCLTVANGFTTYTNTWNSFIGAANPNHQGMIAAMWCDTMTRAATPQQAGMYTYRADAGLPSDRWIAYSRNNRFNRTDDIYIHQMVLYRSGDIALRYEYLSTGALYEDGTWSDNGLNDTIHHTSGISRRNNSDYFWTTPLIEGIGQCPTSYFQYMKTCTYTLGAAEDAGAGWSFAGHFDSRVFDSRSATPDWTTLAYTINSGGGRFTILTRAGSSPVPDGTWSAWQAVATNVNTSGSGAIASPDRRYLQYRCVFQKANSASNPRLDDITISCGRLKVQAVTASTTAGVSQGQDNIPVGVSLINESPVAITVNNLSLGFSLGSYTSTLVTPSLPFVLNAGIATNSTFVVSVWDNSPVGTATIHALATGTAAGPITFADTDADFPHVWRVLRKAQIAVTAVTAIPTTVNKGQTVPVQLTISNQGEVPCTFDAASLTFTLGSYTQLLTAPLLGSIIPASGTINASLSVTVLPISPSGVAILDGNASGTNTYTGKKSEDSGSDVTDSWTIQNPAEFLLESITASSTVFRGQTNTPVLLTVRNLGEAIGNWESSTILPYFTLGSYDAINPTTPFPVQVYGGLATTARYGIDISPTSATGTSAVDARVDGTDGNDGFPITDEYAVYPASWTIVGEKIKTYKDAAFLFESASFNRPFSGTLEVFCRAENLAPLTEFAVRWHDPSGTLVTFTNPPLTSDASGTMMHQYSLSSSSPYGNWTVRITDPLDTYTACLTSFQVVSPASLSVSLQLPPSVTVGQTFVGTMTFSNVGGAEIKSAYPSTLATGGTGLATLAAGPTPLTQDIPGLGTGTFAWNWTAVNPGTFIATGSGLGFDGNSDELLKSATVTSNICTIQTAPIISVASVSESYTNVYLNQTGLTVLLGIRNTGQAAVMVTDASLTFSLGTHFQYLASPSILPFRLAGNSAATFSFDVAVASSSVTGGVTISGSFIGYDANNPAAFYSASGGNGGWTINQVQGICADNSDYNPEQYAFTKNQTVYARFINLPLNTYFRVRFYNAETGGTQVKVSPRLYSGAVGYVDDLWTLLSTDANTVARKWRVAIDDDADNNTTTVGTIFGIQYFQVQNAPQMVATLTLSPTRVFVGEPVYATLIATNTIATAATIYPATPSSLLKTTLSTGDLGYVSGPVPDLASIPSLASATYSWSFVASADTGVVGSLTLIASLGFSVSGLDANNELATTSNRAVSNPIYIYRRALSVASATLDHGTLKPGDIGNTLTFRVDNPGNYQLLSVNWNPTDINGPGTAKISKANLTFAANPLGAIATASNKLASSVLMIPYNQASGTYIATMSIYEDLNGNGSQDFVEPYDLFNVQVVVPLAKVIALGIKSINLGDWTPGQTTTPVGITVLNGGNLDLTNLKFLQTVGSATFITVAPANPGTVPIGLTIPASASAIIPALATPGIYVATWTAFDDEDGDGIIDATEASSTFQIRVGVGFKSFNVAPATISAGISTPTLVVFNLPVGIQNTGPLPLTRLAASFGSLSNGIGDLIASSNLALFPPLTVQIASAATGTINFYSPAGTPVGTYTGTNWIFEDENGNGLWNPGEASASFGFEVYIPPYEAVQVLLSTVDLGDLAPGNGITVSFACRNIGNQLLNQLRWEKINLTDGAKTLNAATYDFPPGVPFSVAPGAFFNRDVSITIPLGQSDGSYLGSAAWLFEDNSLNTARGVDEPQDNFNLTCRVGTLSLDILEAGLTSSGAPFATSTAATFNVSNTGSLTLARLKATGTALVGPQTIPATASVFIPANLGYLLSTQSRSGTWQVFVPANTPAGVYAGTMTVWNDTDDDNVMDGPEASATANLQLTVTSKRVILVVQDPLDLGWNTENSTTQGAFEIRNVGNLDLTDVRLVASEIRNLALDVIPAASITFSPASIGPMAIGAARLATVTVSVGSPQSNGVYTGNLRVYDDYNLANGTWQAAEEFDLFQLRLSIGKKQLAVTPAISYGSVNPGFVHSHLPPFTVSNLTAIPLSRLKWLKGSLTDGINTMAAASQTFTPTGPFSISGNGFANITGQIAIGTFTPPPGTYIGTHTVWEDDNNDGLVQSNEASGTFSTTVTVNAVSALDLLTATVEFGKVARNTPSAWIPIGLRNLGNVDLTNFVWTFQPLAGPGSDNIPTASLSYSATFVPDPIPPGQYGTGTVRIEAIGTTQTLGIHSGSPQTLAGSGGAFDSCAFQVDILPGGPNTSSGTVFQEIATSTFTTAAPNHRYLLSAWVCAGTGTAQLGFLQTTNSGQTLINYDYLRLSPGGVLARGGANVVEAGVSERRQVTLPTGETSFWQRAHIAFDYRFDPTSASETWVLLQNLSAFPTASAAVWFDGVQLEKATFDGQTRPTTYAPGEKIISPNPCWNIEGTKRLYEY